MSLYIYTKAPYVALEDLSNILFFYRFGWVNASYVYGLEILNAHMRRALGTITPYETYRHAMEQSEEAFS